MATLQSDSLGAEVHVVSTLPWDMGWPRWQHPQHTYQAAQTSRYKRGSDFFPVSINLTSWSPTYNTSFKTHFLPGSNICAIWLFYTMNSLDVSLHLVSSASEIPSLGNHSETKKFLQPLLLWRLLADVCDMWGWLISSQLLTPSGNSQAKSPISPQPTSVKERTWARHCPAVQIQLVRLVSDLGSDADSARGCW